MKNDYQTSTVDGAEGFARANAEPFDDGKPTLSELMRVEYEDEDYEDYEDECNCSDPGCPCGGSKRGGL